jgi:hypothetical protein
VEHNDRYKKHFKVTVEDNAVTYISLWMQIIDTRVGYGLSTLGGTNTRTTTVYYLRSSTGSHPLPADEEAKDPAPYITALEDSDHATRLVAVKALRKIKPPFIRQTVARLQTMAREDVAARVRTEAGKLLAERNLALLPAPLYLETFEDNKAKWSADDNGEVMGFSSDGYYVDPNNESYRWSVVDISSNLRKKSEFDAILDCSWRKGVVNFPYGLILGRNKEDFYTFAISRNGGAIVQRWSGGNIKSIPIDWKHDAAKTIGENEFSRIFISKRGDTFTFEVNGVTIGSFADPDKLSVQSVGVFAGNRQGVVFKRIMITEP